MKKHNRLCKFCATTLTLMLLFNGLVVPGYASEIEEETTAENETPRLIEPYDQTVESIDAEDTLVATESVSYPSGFTKASISNGKYYIKNIGTGRYVDIHGPNTDMIHQWRYHSDLQENWEIEKQDDGYYTIKSSYQDKYIGISTTDVGVNNINLYSSISNQTKWVILKNSTGQHTFVPYSNISLMLCAPNASVGTELQLTATNLTNNYNKWILIEQVQNSTTNLIQNIETRRFASPYGPYLDDGTRIHQWNFSTSSARKWLFEAQSDYFFTIKDQYTQKYMGIAVDGENTYIEQFSSISDCTKWKMYKSSSGNLVLTPKGYEPFTYAISVDPSTNNVASILKLVAYTDDGNYKDEWQLVANQTYLGSLSTTWHSNSNSVGYWDLDNNTKNIDIYIQKLNASDNSFYFIEGTDEAIQQWETLLGINFNEVSSASSANIVVYGGTRAQLEDHGGYSNTTWTGLSTTRFSYQGMMNINGGNEIVTIKKMSSSRIDIISRPEDNAVRKCIAHELGHSLGYSGHAPDSTDVMYAYSHESYLLKTLESNHIKVIYTLFNQ